MGETYGGRLARVDVAVVGQSVAKFIDASIESMVEARTPVAYC